MLFGAQGTPGEEVNVSALVVHEEAETWRVVVSNGAGHFNATKPAVTKKRIEAAVRRAWQCQSISL